MESSLSKLSILSFSKLFLFSFLLALAYSATFPRFNVTYRGGLSKKQAQLFLMNIDKYAKKAKTYLDRTKKSESVQYLKLLLARTRSKAEEIKRRKMSDNEKARQIYLIYSNFSAKMEEFRKGGNVVNNLVKKVNNTVEQYNQKSEQLKEVRKLDMQFRAEDTEDNKMEIKGYAVVFNSPETYGYTEVIDSRALDETDMSDVVLRYNHNDSFMVLARTRNKSLQL